MRPAVRTLFAIPSEILTTSVGLDSKRTRWLRRQNKPKRWDDYQDQAAGGGGGGWVRGGVGGGGGGGEWPTASSATWAVRPIQQAINGKADAAGAESSRYTDEALKDDAEAAWE